MKKYKESYSFHKIPFKKKGRGKSRLQKKIVQDFIEGNFTKPIRPLEFCKISVSFYTNKNLSTAHIFHVLEYISESLKISGFVQNLTFRSVGQINYQVFSKRESFEETVIELEGFHGQSVQKEKPGKELFPCLLCEEKVNSVKRIYCKDCADNDVLKFGSVSGYY